MSESEYSQSFELQGCLCLREASTQIKKFVNRRTYKMFTKLYQEIY